MDQKLSSTVSTAPSLSTDLPGDLIPGAPKHKVPTFFLYGNQIGVYKGAAIYDELKDNHGVVRKYGGLAPGKLSDCPPGCVVVGPGLLYEMELSAS